MTFIDTNVLIDILHKDAVWAAWSAQALLLAELPTVISPIVYAELASGFWQWQDLDRELSVLQVSVVDPRRGALFAAGRAHAEYRARGGLRERPLPDFLIGAQAFDERAALVTRDPRRYRTAFPSLRLIAPSDRSP